MTILNKDWLKNLQKNKYLQLLPDFKEEKTQRFVTLILTLFTLSFFGIFAISPTLSTISKLNKELKDTRYTESQLKQKINNLSILQQKYATLQSDLPDIYSAIPKNPDVAIFMGQLKQVAKSSNVTILSAQTFQVEAVTTSRVSKKYSSFNFGISLEGGYNDVASFIDSIGKMQRVVALDSLAITSTVDSQKGNILKLSIKGTAYFKN